MYQMQIVFFYFLIKYNGSKLNLFGILRGGTEAYVWQNSGSEESRFEFISGILKAFFVCHIFTLVPPLDIPNKFSLLLLYIIRK